MPDRAGETVITVDLVADFPAEPRAETIARETPPVRDPLPEPVETPEAANVETAKPVPSPEPPSPVPAADVALPAPTAEPPSATAAPVPEAVQPVPAPEIAQAVPLETKPAAPPHPRPATKPAAPARKQAAPPGKPEVPKQPVPGRTQQALLRPPGGSKTPGKGRMPGMLDPYIAKYRERLARLRATYTEHHPDVVATSRILAHLETEAKPLSEQDYARIRAQIASCWSPPRLPGTRPAVTLEVALDPEGRVVESATPAPAAPKRTGNIG